jgi:hypothetical protein
VFTVIIADEKSAKLIRGYDFLFDTFLDSNDIAICKWNEKGETIVSSVPDLGRAVGGKSKWRAMVLVDPEDPESPWNEHKPDNPFDFCMNCKEELTLEAHRTDIVRLTHMLGGFPPLSVKAFKEYTKYKDETGAEQTVETEALLKDEELLAKVFTEFKHTKVPFYEEIHYSEAEKKKHRELSARYTLDFARPQEIILLSMRRQITDNEKKEAEDAWKKPNEFMSSEFWKRNDYPSICRFVCYDLPAIDNINREKRRFLQILSILSIATNTIPSSTLQAYRLYSVDVEADKEILSDALNDYMGSLHTVADNLKLRIKNEMGRRNDEIGNVLENVNVPVVLSEGERSGLALTKNVFLWFPGFFKGEQRRFLTTITRLFANLDKYLKPIRQSVDTAAGDCRAKIHSFEGEAYDLSRYQVDDLETELDYLESQVLTTNAEGIANARKHRKQMHEIERKIFKRLEETPGRESLAVMLAIASGAFATGVVFVVLSGVRHDRDFAPFSVSMLVVALAIVLAGGAVAFLILHFANLKLVERFNSIIKDLMQKLRQNQIAYEEYLSDICTFQKGRSILDGVELASVKRKQILARLRAHENKARAHLNKLDKLSLAFDFPIQSEVKIDIASRFDSDIPVAQSKFYRLWISDPGEKMHLNTTGEKVSTPYNFLTRLNIERVNVYDEAPNDDLGGFCQ